MSNAGGSQVKPGVITGIVMERYERGVYTAEFDPQFDLWGMATGAISQAQKITSGVISQVQSGGAGLVTQAQNIATGALQQVQQTVNKGNNVYLGSTPARAAVVMPTISIPKFEMPKFEMPKFDLPKISLPAFSAPKITLSEIFGPSLSVAGAAMGAFTKTAAAVISPISPMKTIDLLSVAAPSPKPTDLWGTVQCGVFGCDGKEGVLSQIGRVATSSEGPLFKLGGTDFMKGLPSLSDVQKGTQDLATTFAFINPITAPAAIAITTANYVKNLFTPAPAVTKADVPVPSTFESRLAAVPKPEIPGAIVGCTANNVCDPNRNQYGEDHSLAECTIKRGDYVGYKKRYKYTETFPDDCLLSDEVKFYVPLGNYQQQEVHGIPVYTDKGRIEFYDPITGELIYDANEELLASGAMSVNKPLTSLVTQVWSNEAPVGVAGVDYNVERAKRFAITGFRDANSATLEKQVSNLNKIKGDYTDVSFSRLGAELYNGKVLPIDGRVLDPSLVTEETDYGKKNGYNFPVNNINKVYGDLGQPERGARVAPGMVAASNLKAASAFPGAVTNGIVPGECGFWDIGCKVGNWLSPAAPTAGFVTNTALVITEGILGGLPSLADAAYDTTTGGIEWLRGLDEGTLKRLGSRKAFDTLFEKTAGVTIDKNSYVKALGLEYTEGESFQTGAARVAVSFGQDVMYDPTAWVVPGVMQARFVLAAPEIGKSISDFATGAASTQSETSYMFSPSTEETVVVPAVLKTSDPLKVGTTFTSETLPPGAILV